MSLDTPQVARVLLTLTTVGLAWSAALLLQFGGPPDRRRSLLALALAVGGFADLTNVGRLTADYEVTGAPQFAFTGLQAGFGWKLALLGFLWYYPSPARLRSWHGAVFVTAAALAAAGWLMFVFDRSLMYFPGEAGLRVTLLNRITYFELPHAFLALAMGSSVLRARASSAQPRDARAAGALAPALAYGASWVAFYYVLVEVPLWAMGVMPQLPVSAAFTTGVVGDCCGLARITFVISRIVPVAVPLALALLGHSRVALFLGLAGIPAFFAMSQVGMDFSSVPAALGPLGVMYAIQRHGALGIPRVPRVASAAMALWAMMMMFFIAVTAAVINFPDSPLGLALSTFAGLLLGIGAALLVLPESPLTVMAPPAPPAAANRLGAYRAALEQELAEGRSPAEARERLRVLRRELGVGDSEHAVMEYMLQGARTPGARTQALQPSQRLLDRYQVEARLGEGGAGATYLCRDERVDRRVVLKLLRAAGDGSQGLQRIVREARAMGALQHPNVVTLHDVEQIGDEAFIVMEHLGGGSLEQRLARGPLAGPEFARLADDLLQALGAVHAASLVHRDVKPSNILFTTDGRAKLADFGVAHLPGFHTTIGEGAGAVGTVRYMSPEQARGKRVTAASDLFGAGATLYEAWTGRPYLEPKPGESAAELQIRAAFAEPFAAPVEGPPALRAWFARALEPAAARRFTHAGEMRAALERALAGSAPRAPGGSDERPAPA